MLSASAIIDEPETRFADERMPLSEIADRDLARALQLWERLRDGRTMPPRAAFRPEDLRYCVGRINVIELRTDPSDFIYRLRGTSIAQMHRADGTGQSIQAMTPAAYREMLVRHYTTAIEAREPVLPRIRQYKGSFQNQYRR